LVYLIEKSWCQIQTIRYFYLSKDDSKVDNNSQQLVVQLLSQFKNKR